MRSIRLLFGLAASLLLAACGGGWGDAERQPSLAPQSVAVAAPVTRQYVDGYYVESGASSVPAQVNRLYRAVFARAADAAGLGFHVASIERYGHTLGDVVNGFMASPEFKSAYGSLDDAAFVTLLYTNVLHRDPDTQGFAYWSNLLATGTPRAQVVLGFSESPENIQQTAADVAAGLKFLPYPTTRLFLSDGTYVESNDAGVAAQVFRLYQAAFDRAGDTAGLGFQIGSMETYGLTLTQVAQNFIASPEFAARYGALDNTAFVTQLYANVLKRAPDADGLAYHVANLDAGVPRALVLLGFSESPENKTNTAAVIAAGIRFTPWPAAPLETAVAVAEVQPQFISQPVASPSAKMGATMTLSAEAKGYGALAYQWSRGGVPIAGATSRVYTFVPTYGDDGTSFSVTAGNGLGEARSISATLAVDPPASSLAVKTCRHIIAAGSYSLAADLTPTGNVPCIYIHDAHDVQLDCGGRALTKNSATGVEALSVTNVRNFSVKNCRLDVSLLKVTASTNGSFTGNRVTAVDDGFSGIAVVRFDQSTRMTFDSNVVVWGVFQQFYGDGNVISRNEFIGLSVPDAGSGMIATAFGTGSRIFGNALDGKSTNPDWGPLEGIVVQDESSAVVEDNTVKDVRNCGVTFAGSIVGASVQRNTFTNARACGIGGSAWFSLSGSRIAGNTAQGSLMLFNLRRQYGLRAAGFDDAHKLPADAGVYFRNNVFSGNTLTSPLSADGSTYGYAAYVPIGELLGYDGQVSAIAGESVATPATFDISNNTFTGNDFGHTAKAPWFGAAVRPGMVVDGGGNACSAPEVAAYPLACN